MPEETEQAEGPALDALPESLAEAEAEHALIMQGIQEDQRVIQEAQQRIEFRTRRGIFLEGAMKVWKRPNRAARRAK